MILAILLNATGNLSVYNCENSFLKKLVSMIKCTENECDIWLMQNVVLRLNLKICKNLQ